MVGRKICFILVLIMLLCTVGCSGSDAFTVGEVTVFCPSPYESDHYSNPQSNRYPLYSGTAATDSILTTDTGTYTIQHDGLVGTFGGDRSLKNYRVMRHGNNGWEVVCQARTCGYFPQLALYSNQKGKLVAVTPEEYGIAFGIYDEVTGEFAEVKYAKTGYSVQRYISGVDPHAGEEGTVYMIISHPGIDDDTKVFTLDIANRTVTEQVLSVTPYPFAAGYLVFDEQSNAQIVLAKDGMLCCFSATGLGTSSQTVGNAITIASGNIDENVGAFDVALDQTGALHVFYRVWENETKICHAVLSGGDVISDEFVLSGDNPFACFTGGNGEIYLICMQEQTQQSNQSVEGVIYRMDSGEKNEVASIFIDDVPGIRGRFNIATPRLGGRTDRGTWMIYLAAQSDNFVSIELKTEQ